MAGTTGHGGMAASERFARDRALAVHRGVYEWARLPGLPPFSRTVPPHEKTARR